MPATKPATTLQLPLPHEGKWQGVTAILGSWLVMSACCHPLAGLQLYQGRYMRWRQCYEPVEGLVNAWVGKSLAHGWSNLLAGAATKPGPPCTGWTKPAPQLAVPRTSGSSSGTCFWDRGLAVDKGLHSMSFDAAVRSQQHLFWGQGSCSTPLPPKRRWILAGLELATVSNICRGCV